MVKSVRLVTGAIALRVGLLSLLQVLYEPICLWMEGQAEPGCATKLGEDGLSECRCKVKIVVRHLLLWQAVAHNMVEHHLWDEGHNLGEVVDHSKDGC